MTPIFQNIINSGRIYGDIQAEMLANLHSI